MGGIADAEEAAPIPAGQSIHLHSEQPDGIPIQQFADTVRGKRRDSCDAVTKRLQSPLPELFERPFRDHEAALPVRSTVDRDKYPSAVEAARSFFRIGGEY